MNYLKELKLTNFRCFNSLHLNFNPKVNILVGNNAVGKTTIVESVHCLGLLKSHRTSLDQQLIQEGCDYAIALGKFSHDEKTNEVVFSISPKGKKIVFNNKPYPNLSDYIGYLSVVMFCPEDLDLVKGSPSSRRKFLDANISQINNTYLHSSIKYKKLLKERNEVLTQITEKKHQDYNLLNIYTNALINEAKIITNLRRDFINKINPYVLKFSKAISNDLENVKIEYKPSINGNIEEIFKNNLNTDLSSMQTTKGPHRDDFLIELNGKDICIYGSQGQQRTAVLAIKLALAEVLKQKNENLVVILDDVFSELDLDRQNQIINLLSDTNQIFITTTSISNLSTKIIEKSLVIQISKESEASGESRTTKE